MKIIGLRAKRLFLLDSSSKSGIENVIAAAAEHQGDAWQAVPCDQRLGPECPFFSKHPPLPWNGHSQSGPKFKLDLADNMYNMIGLKFSRKSTLSKFSL